MIAYNEAMDDEVMEILKRCISGNYTKIVNAFGKGGTSGTHLGDDIWPGKNNVLYIACADAEAKRILSCVRELRKKLGKEGIKAFVWDLAEVT